MSMIRLDGEDGAVRYLNMDSICRVTRFDDGPVPVLTIFMRQSCGGEGNLRLRGDKPAMNRAIEEFTERLDSLTIRTSPKVV